MKKNIGRILILTAVLTLIVSAASASWNPFTSRTGSCGSIVGKTVLVSIFVSDPASSWNFDKKADFDSYTNLYWRLSDACGWLSQQVSRYSWGRADFVWDWYNQPYLYYEFRASRYMNGTDNAYSDLRDFIRSNVDLNRIKDYYRADNVIFLAYYNVDKKVRQQCWAWNYDFYNAPGADSEGALEIVWLLDGSWGYPCGAATFAHEMMHCFGAVDLYKASEKVPQRYVDRLKKSRSKDIMYTIDYSTPNTIKEKFTDLDAYYLGLLSYADDVRAYGLTRSAFDW